MWQPEPGWEPLPGGRSGQGVWRTGPADSADGAVHVVTRLSRPGPDDPADLLDPGHPAWWRRPADVALDPAVAGTSGVRPPGTVRVEEDEAGITLWQDWVPAADLTGLFRARALGRFAGASVARRPWHADALLRDRLRMVERRGGWRTLARTPVADASDRLWHRRTDLLDDLDALPRVPQHGDPTPANLRGRDGDDVVAVDWSTFGTGPVGADVGYLSLTTREELGPLLDAYTAALPAGLADRRDAELGARVMAVYTVLTRADWALARVPDRDGALAGSYRHPSVAPYLRSLQRQLPQIEALLA